MVRERIRGMIADSSQLDVMSLRYRTNWGELRWFEVHATVLRDGASSAPSILLSARDVHEQRLAQDALTQKTDQLETLSTTDALTGLLNRRAFMERGRELIERAGATGRGLAVVFIDLDGLKPLNDQHGHEVGDRALSEAAQVLRQTCRGGDLVARLGGDEFVVLARDLTPEGYIKFRLRLDAALLAFNAAPNRPFGLSFSIGAAFAQPGSDESIESLVQRADAEMYEEKRARRVGRT
jgi:diguanylate cyclase (GGDEF)-like protein